MPRKAKTEKPLTLEERREWEAFCDDLDGKFEPMDPQDINVAKEAEEYLKQFGDSAAVQAAYRAECAHFEEDREDWNEVVRVIKARQAEMKGK